MLPTLYPPRPEGAPSFYEPGDGKGYLETVADWTPSVPGAIRAVESAGTPEGKDLLTAAYGNSLFNRFVSSRDLALEEATDLRIDGIRRATGVELQNPYRNGYNVEARARVASRRFDPDYDPRSGIPGEARAIFDEQIADVIAKHGEKVADLDLQQPIEEKARAIATSFEDSLPGAQARAAAAGISPQQQMLFQGFESGRAGLSDPLTLFSMAAGPGFAFGKSALMRIATEGAGQGLFNVGLLLAEHPTIDAWRQERGKASAGHLPTMQETAIAFAAGAIPGAGLRILIEALPKLRPDLGPKVIAAGERAAEADRTALDAIPSVSRESVPSEPVVAEGMTRLYRGETAGSPSKAPMPDWLAESPVVQGNLAAEGRWFGLTRESAEYYAEKHGVKGHNDISYVDVPTADVEKYLAKNNPDAAKFSAVGRETEEYFVPREIADSRKVLAKAQAGEQQIEALAQAARHAADPAHEPPPAPVVAPVAGSPERASELAALVRRVDNDPVEVVESMRAASELAEAAAASGEQNLVNAAKMSTLSEPAWRAVKDGVASPEHGLIAAEHAPNPSDHLPVIERLTNEAPQTSKEARVIAADEVAGQSVKSETVSLQKAVAEKPRIGTVPEERRSLLQFLAGRGGVAHTDELRALFGDRSSYIRPYGKLLKEDAEQLGVRAEQAFAAGYIAEPSEKALLAAIEGEVGGTKVYRSEFATQGAARDVAKATAAETKAAREKARADLFNYLGETSSEIRPAFPGSEVSNRRIFKDTVNLLTKGEETDVAAALRRASSAEFEKETAKAATRRKSPVKQDPMDTIPTEVEDGSTLLLSREDSAARIEDKQSLADLVRSCKE